MSFKYIQDYYGVPAKRGARVQSRGEIGTVVSASGQYINIRWDRDSRGRIQGPYHPTDEIEYLSATASDVPERDAEHTNVTPIAS